MNEIIKDEEISVLNFFKQQNFPGLRLGERDNTVKKHLKSISYSYTPDLISGPTNLEEAPLEGLFFIDVNKPSGDLLFKSIASKQLKIDIAQTTKEIFEKNKKNDKDTLIESLPKEHLQLYLNVLNDKLNKYAHNRKFVQNGKSMVTTNFGIVHHFDLGILKGKNISNSKSLITLIDYIRFYKSLAPTDNIDLRNAENILLKEIIGALPLLL